MSATNVGTVIPDCESASEFGPPVAAVVGHYQHGSVRMAEARITRLFSVPQKW